MENSFEDAIAVFEKYENDLNCKRRALFYAAETNLFFTEFFDPYEAAIGQLGN